MQTFQFSAVLHQNNTVKMKVPIMDIQSAKAFVVSFGESLHVSQVQSGHVSRGNLMGKVQA